MKKRKGVNGKLDDAWSYLVKILADKKCAKCGKTTHLNSHHIYSRSKFSTRWDLMNGICLCSGCHVLSSTFSAHKTPFEFKDWFEKEYGVDHVNELMQRANTHRHWTKHEKERLLEELKQKIVELDY